MRRKYADVLVPRGRELVKRWAKSLGPKGWTGSVPDLRAALTKLARWGDHVPVNCTAMVEDGLSGSAYRLVRRRDREGRYVIVEPVKV